jgi:hypothetical protein
MESAFTEKVGKDSFRGMLAIIHFTLVYISVSDSKPPNIKICRITILAAVSY